MDSSQFHCLPVPLLERTEACLLRAALGVAARVQRTEEVTEAFAEALKAAESFVVSAPARMGAAMRSAGVSTSDLQELAAEGSGLVQRLAEIASQSNAPTWPQAEDVQVLKDVVAHYQTALPPRIDRAFAALFQDPAQASAAARQTDAIRCLEDVSSFVDGLVPGAVSPAESATAHLVLGRAARGMMILG